MTHHSIDCQEQFDYIITNIKENDAELFDEWGDATFDELDDDQLEILWQAYQEMMSDCYGGSD